MQGKHTSIMGIIREQGFMSLYDGLAAGVGRQVFYASSRLGLFDTCRDWLHEYRGKTDFAGRVVVGAATGAAAAVISCPMEVATVRMSNDVTLPPEERRNYKGVVDVFKRIYTEEGISAFWRGSVPFAQRAALVGVFQVATLDQFKELYAHYLNQKKGSLSNVFCSAMSSGLIYSIATMPLEASKNRMASQKPDSVTGKLPYTSTLQTMKTVTANEGFLALYNGFLPYYIRCGGHTIAMFITVQMMRDFYASTM
jgi:solute carrier family 25 oxoglutarate transporter 11